MCSDSNIDRSEMRENNSEDSEHLKRFNEEFLEEYRKFVTDFDSLAVDLFQGESLDRLAQDFLGKHKDYIRKFPYAVVSNYPDCDSDEDLRIVSTQTSADTDGDGIETTSGVLGNLLRRACQGCYLRITFNKSRRKQEDDRREAVELGRQAIRYAPNSFKANYWYMIAVGWQLESITNTRDRVASATIFQQLTKRCIQLNPRDALAYNLLGRYYYNVASLTWLEKTVAHRLIGYKLEGTYELAEDEFRRALERKSDWLPSGLWLAKVLLAQKKPMDEVRHWIEFGLRFDSLEPTTEIEREELLELRSKLKCGLAS